MLELLIKATLLLALALGIAACLPRTQPRLRHQVLLTSLLVLPLLPLVALLPPLIALPHSLDAPPLTLDARLHLLNAPVLTVDAPIHSVLASTHLINARLHSLDAPARTLDAPVQLLLPRVLLVVYGLGVLVLLMRFLSDQRALRRLLRTAAPSSLGAPFPVLLTPEPTVPLACGILRRVILLPKSATSWEPERLHAVLQHESAHLMRRDPPWQAFSTLLCALCWPHPLVWLVARRLAAEAESACDAAVLESGISPSHYAAHLLAIAKQSRKTRLLSPGLGQPGKLEKRVRSILAFVPARSLPVLAVVSLIAVAIACIPLLL